MCRPDSGGGFSGEPKGNVEPVSSHAAILLPPLRAGRAKYVSHILTIPLERKNYVNNL